MSADKGEYRMSPHFQHFLEAVGGSVERAMVAWDIAAAAFSPKSPEGEFEVWQGDICVAGCSGPRGRALAEAVHYAVMYQTDTEPCVIQEVTRKEIAPDDAHYLIASAMSAGTAKTPKAVEGEARQRGPAKQETPK